ncbi:MAG: alpha/beta hydrolase [Hyphomicrobiaceae bacterium]|nr:alpha/beta hydrolase [Hyphomicrobiaceae bacterium]
MLATELRSDEAGLKTARAVTLLGALAACLWMPAFWLFIVVYALGVLLYLTQRCFIFRPTARRYRLPASLRLEGIREIWLNSADGEQIMSWQMRPQKGMPTLLYLHGNNCNLSNRLERTSRFVCDGYGLMMPSFRGYGLSTGSPSERNSVSDALMAYEALRQQNVAAKDIIVYGESLGTGVAVQIAALREVGALVLEAPYTSLADLVRHRWRFIPAYKFLKDEFNSVEHIKKVTAPLLIVHSLEDEVIPIAFGRCLFEAAKGDKEFLRVRGAGHFGLFRSGGWPKICAFIENHVESARQHGETIRKKEQIRREAAQGNASKLKNQASPGPH